MTSYKSILGFLLIITSFLSCRTEEKEEFKIPENLPIDSLYNQQQDILFLTEAISNNPNISTNYYKRSLLYGQTGNWVLAQKDINRAVALKPNIDRYLIQQAAVYVELEEWEKGLAALQKAESLGYKEAKLYLLQARVYLGLKDTFNAQNSLNRAKKMAPFTPENYYYQGVCYLQKKDTAASITQFRRAVEVNPSNILSYKQLIPLYLGQKKVDSSLQFNQKALQQYPNDLPLQMSKASLLTSAFLLDSASVVYSGIIKKNPSYQEAYLKLAAVYLRKDHKEKALNTFKSLVKVAPEKVEYVMSAGKIAETLGKLTEAKQIYQQGFERHPDNYNLELAIDRLNRKNAYFASPSQASSLPRKRKVSTSTTTEEVSQEPTLRGTEIQPIKTKRVSIRKDSTSNK
ncbi:MAG: tetratricopeptide repeat protein [Spirosomataceae bacterium]